jgi:hypothetical protein
MLGAGLKAGIIMGIVVAVVAVISNLVGLSDNPVLGLLTCFLSLVILVLWFVSGILAARFGPLELTGGAAAGAGAIAGAITQVIGGIVDVLASSVMQLLGLVPAISTQIPPETMRQLAQAGASPEDMRTIMSVVQLAAGPVGSCICCVGIATAIAAGLGAVGGIAGKAIWGGKT